VNKRCPFHLSSYDILLDLGLCVDNAEFQSNFLSRRSPPASATKIHRYVLRRPPAALDAATTSPRLHRQTSPTRKSLAALFSAPSTAPKYVFHIGQEKLYRHTRPHSTPRASHRHHHPRFTHQHSVVRAKIPQRQSCGQQKHDPLLTIPRGHNPTAPNRPCRPTLITPRNRRTTVTTRIDYQLHGGRPHESLRPLRLLGPSTGPANLEDKPLTSKEMVLCLRLEPDQSSICLRERPQRSRLHLRYTP